MTSGLARSVQTRLVRHAQALGVDPNLVLARYATERRHALPALAFAARRAPFLAKELRTALIAAAVTGRIDVREVAPVDAGRIDAPG
ncbi:MAG: hypothetical protein LC667_19945 [Thioalkalivibrio sp.]|nr:hypothetical protein [Thioalkalivibrio sp.]